MDREDIKDKLQRQATTLARFSHLKEDTQFNQAPGKSKHQAFFTNSIPPAECPPELFYPGLSSYVHEGCVNVAKRVQKKWTL